LALEIRHLNLPEDVVAIRASVVMMLVMVLAAMRELPGAVAGMEKRPVAGRAETVRTLRNRSRRIGDEKSTRHHSHENSTDHRTAPPGLHAIVVRQFLTAVQTVRWHSIDIFDMASRFPAELNQTPVAAPTRP
jgi:hypothetical protein